MIPRAAESPSGSQTARSNVSACKRASGSLAPISGAPLASSWNSAIRGSSATSVFVAPPEPAMAFRRVRTASSENPSRLAFKGGLKRRARAISSAALNDGDKEPPMKSEETAFGPAPWASHSIGKEPHVTLEALQAGLTVNLIATALPFVTCAMVETLAQVVELNRQNQFDFLPVTERAINGAVSPRIVGLLEIASYRSAATLDGSVAAAMRFLSEENLI